MRKSILSLLSFALLFLIIGTPAYAKDETVIIDSVTVYASSVNITGTTDATAVTIQVRDASGIVSMDTVGTKDGTFTKSVAGSYTVGETYTVYVADYEGGSWATFTEIAIADPQSPPPSTPTSDPTPDSGSNNSNLGATPTTTPAETPKAKGPAKKETITEEKPGRIESDPEEVTEKEETTEESVQDIKEPVKENEEVVTENTETKEPEKTAVAETKEPKKEGKTNKILLVVVAILATCAIASGIILFALKKKEES